MTSTQVEVFLSVCKTLNFTRTAQELHFTPQGVSKIIAGIEEELGLTLFVRNSSLKKLELTDAGQYCMDTLARSQSQYIRTMGEISGQLRQTAGRLRLGISEWVDPYAPELTEALLQYRRENPELNLSAVCHDNGTLCDMLLDDRLDVILFSGSQLVPNRKFGTTPLARERIKLAVPLSICGADPDTRIDPACWGASYVSSPVQPWNRAESIPVIRKELSLMGMEPAEVQLLPNVSSLRAALIFGSCVHITDTRFGFVRRLPGLRYFDVPQLDREQLVCMWSLCSENPRITQFARFMREKLGDFGPECESNQLPTRYRTQRFAVIMEDDD